MEVVSDDVAWQFMFLQTVLACVCSVRYYRARNSRHRRWWVHPLNQRKIQQGDFHNLLWEMRDEDPEQFFYYMRMNPTQFDILLDMVTPFLKKKSNRASLPVALCLSVTLW